jgi:rubrerythrin
MSSENPFVNTLRSKASISQIRSQIESSTAIHQQNFNTLKKKLSMSQMSSSSDSFHSNQSKTSSKTSINLNENISKLQNETKTMFSKSFKYVNTLSKEIQCKLKNEPLLKHDEFNGDTSDEESGASGWKRRTILQEDISKPIENGIKLYSHDEKDEHEDYDDDYTDFNETGEWGYGEADASDYMVAVK